MHWLMSHSPSVVQSLVIPHLRSPGTSMEIHWREMRGEWLLEMSWLWGLQWCPTQACISALLAMTMVWHMKAGLFKCENQVGNNNDITVSAPSFLVKPRAARAYSSLFVCVCVCKLLLYLLYGWILRASKALYMNKTTFSWIVICSKLSKLVSYYNIYGYTKQTKLRSFTHVTNS